MPVGPLLGYEMHMRRQCRTLVWFSLRTLRSMPTANAEAFFGATSDERRATPNNLFWRGGCYCVTAGSRQPGLWHVAANSSFGLLYSRDRYCLRKQLLEDTTT